MLIVDVVIVNVALSAIRDDLDLPDSRLQLVAVAYTLTFGSLLIVLGRLGDLVGRRRLLIGGLGVFTVASLLTGVAHTEWQLLASRAGQGVGAAFVSPAALALLTTSFTDIASRNKALGYWGVVGSAGAISGQLLGGLLTDVFGWRSIFLINVPIGVLTIVAAIRFVDESRAEGARRVNPTSAACLTGGLIAVTYALTRLAEAPTDRASLAVGAMSCVVLTGFWISERTSATPLVDVAVVKAGAVVPANLLLALECRHARQQSLLHHPLPPSRPRLQPTRRRRRVRTNHRDHHGDLSARRTPHHEVRTTTNSRSWIRPRRRRDGDPRSAPHRRDLPR